MILKQCARVGQVAALAFAVAPLIAAQSKPIATLTAPTTWADIDPHAIKGRPARLAWFG